jgi:hypothetical protein
LRCQVRDYEIANYTFFWKSTSLTTYFCTSTGTLSNTDCAIPTSDDLEILKEVSGSESGREKGLPSIGKPSVRSIYLNIPTSVSFVCYLLGYILEVMDTSMKTEKITLASRIGQVNSCTWLMGVLLKTKLGAFLL